MSSTLQFFNIHLKERKKKHIFGRWQKIQCQNFQRQDFDSVLLEFSIDEP